MSDVNKSGNMEELSIFKAINLKIEDPEKVALRFVNEDGTEEPVSYRILFEQTNRTAHALLKAGIGKGDTFTMLMKNHKGAWPITRRAPVLSAHSVSRPRDWWR